jgi:hypothetical protein
MNPEFKKTTITKIAKAMRREGETLTFIATFLNKKGMRTKRGKKFTDNNLRTYMSAARKAA